jgi:DNA-binding NarL/FixJ family response regulator
MTQLTELLRRLYAGDDSARDALFSAAYAELHRLAQSRLPDRGCSVKEIAGTLQVTERTVQRDWEKARRILAAALQCVRWRQVVLARPRRRRAEWCG